MLSGKLIILEIKNIYSISKFKYHMNRIALITGATSGIGFSTAKILAKNNFDLIITGRRDERLKDFKKELESSGNTKVLTICFDVRNRKQVIKAITELPKEWKNIDVLVNNAGLASGFGHIQDGDIEDWEQMIDTNIKGLLYVTKVVLPGMVSRNSGHIINISSIAGQEVYENGNVYCASKHAVSALSKSMRIDLLKNNIKVTNISPGMAETEFSIVRFHGDKTQAKKFYEGLIPLSGDDIADAILYVLTRPPHVCINEMLIMPTAQATATITNRVQTN
jgi:3-hydroxy acid dehydrogenase/malonic semialdehyde reductase